MSDHEHWIRRVEGHARSAAAPGPAEVADLIVDPVPGGTSVYLSAQLGPDGVLCIAGQDLRAGSDHEYFLDVASQDVERVVAALVTELGMAADDVDAILFEGGPIEQEREPRAHPRASLPLIRHAYRLGRFRGRSDFSEFLNRYGIPYTLFSCGS